MQVSAFKGRKKKDRDFTKAKKTLEVEEISKQEQRKRVLLGLSIYILGNWQKLKGNGFMVFLKSVMTRHKDFLFSHDYAFLKQRTKASKLCTMVQWASFQYCRWIAKGPIDVPSAMTVECLGLLHSSGKAKLSNT